MSREGNYREKNYKSEEVKKQNYRTDSYANKNYKKQSNSNENYTKQPVTQKKSDVKVKKKKWKKVLLAIILLLTIVFFASVIAIERLGLNIGKLTLNNKKIYNGLIETVQVVKIKANSLFSDIKTNFTKKENIENQNQNKKKEENIPKEDKKEEEKIKIKKKEELIPYLVSIQDEQNNIVKQLDLREDLVKKYNEGNIKKSQYEENLSKYKSSIKESISNIESLTMPMELKEYREKLIKTYNKIIKIMDIEEEQLENYTGRETELKNKIDEYAKEVSENEKVLIGILNKYKIKYKKEIGN